MRVIGLPESLSNVQLTDICTNIIPEQLGIRTPWVIERVHRIDQHTEQRAKPRPVIVRYLNYADKNAILQKFRCSHTLSVEGADLLLFGDYLIEVMRQCKAFSSICSTLYSSHIKFTLAYPAVLHIQSPTGEHLTFSSPADAEQYINNPSDMDTEVNNSAETLSTVGKSSRASSRKQHSPEKPAYKRGRFANQAKGSENH